MKTGPLPLFATILIGAYPMYETQKSFPPVGLYRESVLTIWVTLHVFGKNWSSKNWNDESSQKWMSLLAAPPAPPPARRLGHLLWIGNLKMLLTWMVPKYDSLTRSVIT